MSVPLATAREKGNRLFGAGKYPEAIDAYSEGLDAPESEDDPSRHIVLCNRAMCHMRVDDPGSAFHDGVEATQQNPDYIKGWWRLVDACIKLGQRREMVAYYLDQVLRRDPTLPEARQLRTKLVAESFQEAATFLSRDAPEKAQEDDVAAGGRKRENREMAELAGTAMSTLTSSSTKTEKKIPFRERARQLVAQAEGATWIGVESTTAAAAVAAKSLLVSDEESWDQCLLVLFVLIVSKSREDLSRLLDVANQDADGTLLRQLLLYPVIEMKSKSATSVAATTNRWSLLHVACFTVKDGLSTFRFLLLLSSPRKVLDTSFTAPSARSVLSEAVSAAAASPDAFESEREALELCIEHAENIDRPDQVGDRCSPLWVACREGAVPVVRMLLQAGADCNVQNRKGETPLHCAVLHGGIQVVRTLLYPSQPNKNDSSSSSSSNSSSSSSSSGTGEGKKKVNADLKTFSDQLSPLHLVLQQPDKTTRLGMLRLLLQRTTNESSSFSTALFDPPNVNAVNAVGQRPLHSAAMFGDLDCCKELVASGADPRAQCGMGLSVMEYAQRGGNPGAVTQWLSQLNS